MRFWKYTPSRSLSKLEYQKLKEKWESRNSKCGQFFLKTFEGKAEERAKTASRGAGEAFRRTGEYCVCIEEDCYCSSVAQSRPTLCNPMDCNTPGFPVLHYLPEFAQTHVHWVDDAIQPSHPLLPLFLPSIFPSIGDFSNESALCIRWPKYSSFSFSPSNVYSGLISFRIDWLVLLAPRGSQQSSRTPQLGNISSSVLSPFYGPTPTSTHDYWKNSTFN